MASQTETRILRFVPPVLNKERQLELLSIYIPSIMAQMSSLMSEKAITTSKMREAYVSVAKAIVRMEYRLDWFVKGAFESAELEEFFKVLKYTMLDCLNRSYMSVCQDLRVVNEHVPRVKGVIELAYQIAIFDCPLDVDVCPVPGDESLTARIPEPRLVTEFREQYSSIILEHAVRQMKETLLAMANKELLGHDLQSLASSLDKIAQDQLKEYDSTFEGCGAGGKIRVRVRSRNRLRLRIQAAKQTGKIVLLLGISATAAFWLIDTGNWGWVVLGGFFVVPTVLGMCEGLRKSIREVKEYGRNRTARFTATRF